MTGSLLAPWIAVRSREDGGFPCEKPETDSPASLLAPKRRFGTSPAIFLQRKSFSQCVFAQEHWKNSATHQENFATYWKNPATHEENFPTYWKISEPHQENLATHWENSRKHPKPTS